MSIKTKWYGEEVKGKYNIATLSALTASAITLEGEIVKEIMNMNIFDTGRYAGSITYKTRMSKSSPISPATTSDELQSTPKEFEALVGTGLVYAPPLEFGGVHRSKNGKVGRYQKPRPAIRKATDQSKALIVSVFIKQFAKMFK